MEYFFNIKQIKMIYIFMFDKNIIYNIYLFQIKKLKV